MRRYPFLAALLLLAACASTPTPTPIPPTATPLLPTTTVQPTPTVQPTQVSVSTPTAIAVATSDPCGDFLQAGVAPYTVRQSQVMVALQTLADAEKRWQMSGVKSYRLRFSAIRMAVSADKKVVVHDGIPESIPQCNGKNWDNCLVEHETVGEYTVPGLFKMARNTVSDACQQSSVQYDGTYGFPINIRGVSVHKVTDSDYDLNIKEFEVLP